MIVYIQTFQRRVQNGYEGTRNARETHEKRTRNARETQRRSRNIPISPKDRREEKCFLKLRKAAYTATPVACGWAGAVIRLCWPRNSEICDRKLDDTDRPTDRRTDGPTASYRVACTRLKSIPVLHSHLLSIACAKENELRKTSL